jgi:REP element-mobilizing transposase RayT
VPGMRGQVGEIVCHVLNRANGRLRIFRKEIDFLAFEKILAEGVAMFSMRLCGYCIMGNHWHLLLSPRGDPALLLSFGAGFTAFAALAQFC